jgi:hypothetical protein
VIANAIDLHAGSERSQRVQAETEALSELGFKPEEVDLRDYFNGKKTLKASSRSMVYCGYGAVTPLSCVVLWFKAVLTKQYAVYLLKMK